MARIGVGPLKKALVLENPHPSLAGLLEDQGISVDWRQQVPTEQQLLSILAEGEHEILFKRSRVPVTRALIEAAPSLKVIQLCCIGDDSVDKQACADHGVLVFNDPVSNGRSVVELVIGHLISLSRQLYETFDATHQGIWEKTANQRFEIRGKILGIYGMGRIGRGTARAAEGMGMEVLFWDNREVAQEVGQEMGWKLADSPEKLFRGSDAVSMHVSAEDTHGASNVDLLPRELLDCLGADRPENSPRLFINAARGLLFRPEWLIESVRNGNVQRAAVDVYPVEPGNNTAGWDNPYAGEPRIATTPHIGAATQEAQPRIAKRVAQTVRSYSQFAAIRDCVLSPRTTISMADEMQGKTVLFVVHATTRGTKRALDDAIFAAGADNLRSTHRDFPRWGIALDVNLLNQPLSQAQLQEMTEKLAAETGDPNAVRLVRQVQG
jgi:D-3-phosphoglycerate dehydrogenase